MPSNTSCKPVLYSWKYYDCKKMKQIKLQVHTFLSGVDYEEWLIVKGPKNDDLEWIVFLSFLVFNISDGLCPHTCLCFVFLFPAAVGLRSWGRWRRVWGGHRGGGGPASCAHLLSAKEHAGHRGARPAETQTALRHLPEAGRQCAGGPAPLYRIQVSGLKNICYMVNCKLLLGSSLSHWTFLPAF